MNFQTAAIVGASCGVLSFLAGLLGGVPVFDIVIRALFWAAFGFGGSLGIETLLRSLLPDLFVPSETASPADEASPLRAVDITLDEEPARQSGFVEEVGDSEELGPTQASPVFSEAAVAPLETSGEPRSSEMGGAENEEEMPEIGAFLDAFKPGSSEEGGMTDGPTPEYGDYAPVAQTSGSSQEVTFDGEAQDPQILAKAVQTIMKRDA